MHNYFTIAQEKYLYNVSKLHSFFMHMHGYNMYAKMYALYRIRMLN